MALLRRGDMSVTEACFAVGCESLYERHLRGNTSYDTYLTGADAQARYVTTGQATIASK